MDEYLSLQLLPACTNRAVLGGALLLLNINCYPENYWATQFLTRHRAVGATMSNATVELGFQQFGNRLTRQFYGLMFLAFSPCAASTSHQVGVELSRLLARKG